MCFLTADLITTKSWRAGAKLVRQDLGVSLTGEKRPQDLVRPSAGDDADVDEKCRQEQRDAKPDALLQDLVTITAGISSMNMCFFMVTVVLVMVLWGP